MRYRTVVFGLACLMLLLDTGALANHRYGVYPNEGWRVPSRFRDGFLLDARQQTCWQANGEPLKPCSLQCRTIVPQIFEDLRAQTRNVPGQTEFSDRWAGGIRLNEETCANSPGQYPYIDIYVEFFPTQKTFCRVGGDIDADTCPASGRVHRNDRMTENECRVYGYTSRKRCGYASVIIDIDGEKWKNKADAGQASRNKITLLHELSHAAGALDHHCTNDNIATITAYTLNCKGKKSSTWTSMDRTAVMNVYPDWPYAP